MASMTPERRARLSEDGASVLCGRVFPTGHRCPVELARVLDEGGRLIVTLDSDWREEGDRIRRTGWERKKRGYAPTREGWMTPPPGFPRRLKARKSFPFTIPVECPQCNLLNIFDAKYLGVVDRHRPGV